MTEKNGWSQYIDATSNGALNIAIAERLNVDPATVGRWRTGAVDPKPRQVVAYARAFGQSPVQALVAAGYLAPEELDIEFADPRERTLDDFSTLELAEEIADRLSGDADHSEPPSERRARLPIDAATSVDASVGGVADDYALAASDDDDWQARQEAENE